jgi:hypothetical protein
MQVAPISIFGPLENYNKGAELAPLGFLGITTKAKKPEYDINKPKTGQ